MLSLLGSLRERDLRNGNNKSDQSENQLESEMRAESLSAPFVRGKTSLRTQMSYLIRVLLGCSQK